MTYRYLSSAPIAIAVTGTLLFLMHSLIESGIAAGVNVTERIVVPFVRIKVNEIVRIDHLMPEAIDAPVNPPPIIRETFDSSDGTPLSPGHMAPPEPAPPPGFIGTAFSDGPLVSIMKVSPTYPPSAAQKNLDGFVVVQFDVTAIGTIENAVVLESSSRLFNKAAIAAAVRFRYKPRIVNGIAESSHGLRHKFVFRMED